MDPERALASWSRQLTPEGRIYIEHTMAHSASHANEMDPFGAHPMAMPYLFFIWGREKYSLVDIMTGKKRSAQGVDGMDVWVFVLESWRDG